MIANTQRLEGSEVLALPRPTATRREQKTISYCEVDMTVTRDLVEILVQVQITNKGVGLAWCCETKGEWKNGTMIYLYPEEEQEALSRYVGQPENLYDEAE